MGNEVLILIIEAMLVYFMVLWAHSLRHRFGPVHFFALIGGLTAIMSWVTDAGLSVEFAGITFVVGSTVFYTSLLLAIFVVYVFDGPYATRIAISTVVAVSAMVPLIAATLHVQMNIIDTGNLLHVPLPSLRINIASIVATMLDLVFLAMAWEFLGKRKLRLPLWARSYLTLLGVMWLDVILFSIGAFAGTEQFSSIMMGTLASRLVISFFAFPLLYGYLRWQKDKAGATIENRPVLAILKEVTEIESKLFTAKKEIERRKVAEAERDEVITELKQALAEVKTLRGFLPICSICKKIRDDKGYWTQIESYIHSHSEAQFTHGICPDCMQDHYPEFCNCEKDDKNNKGDF